GLRRASGSTDCAPGVRLLPHGQSDDGAGAHRRGTRGARRRERLMVNILSRVWEVLTSKVDSFLFGIAIAIAGVGLITLFSAMDQNAARIMSQATSLGFALVLMWIVANIPPQTIARSAVPLYLLAVVMLTGVAMFGTTVN